MNSSLCCVIQDARGRYRVSGRETDIAQFPKTQRYVSFDVGYRVANRLNAYRRELKRAAAPDLPS
jgi:hypothetical protein